jgi:hypothetical protein
MSDTVQCPACNKTIPVKAIPKHTNGCPKWQSVIGVPPSDFNFARHFKRGLYADGLVDGRDYVVCPLCSDHRAKRLADHMKLVHTLSKEQVIAQFPNIVLCAPRVLEQRKATVQERYGVDNVSMADDVRAKLVENSRANEPEVTSKRKATNVTRYGHHNPLGGIEGNKRAREGMQRLHGASSPQQVPAIRQRTLATNLERHGSKYAFTAPGFQDQFKATSQEHWGADHPMQSDAGKQACFDTMQTKYGVDTVFSIPDVQHRAYQTNLDNHGGKHSQQDPDVLAKARATWLEKYGVDNPSKTEEVKNRIKDVWMGKYGVPFPPQSLWSNRALVFPNKLEQTVATMCPVNVVYAGDGSYWVRAAGESRARNPDFVVLTADQALAYQAGANLNGLRTWRVIEVFGDFWHGPTRTGKERHVHQADVVAYYGKAGIECLVLWEDEIKKHPTRVAERLKRYLEV